MKYMGSKRWMLQNGLGKLLESECGKAKRFVDLFAGSGAVSCFVSGKISIPVLATDLQEFSTVLTNSIITRQKPLDASIIWNNWIKNAQNLYPNSMIPSFNKLTIKEVEKCRAWCNEQKEFPITLAYGGHYFSPEQSLWIDLLRQTLPDKNPERTVALAALIIASSQCAAAPGHTAQPFQPTRTAKYFLNEAWKKDITKYVKQFLYAISPLYAKVKGLAKVADANHTAGEIIDGDLIFIDPPYSEVQYSRFYHVLESITTGKEYIVSGIGRYPDISYRPQSKYCLKSFSKQILCDLFNTISEKNVKVILTFPQHACSNGLSGPIIIDEAKKLFNVSYKTVKSKFSTLGGNGNPSSGRKARQHANELIIKMSPKTYFKL